MRVVNGPLQIMIDKLPDTAGPKKAFLSFQQRLNHIFNECAKAVTAAIYLSRTQFGELHIGFICINALRGALENLKHRNDNYQDSFSWSISLIKQGMFYQKDKIEKTLVDQEEEKPKPE